MVLAMTSEMSHREIAPGKILITLSGKIMMGHGGEGIVPLVEELLREGKRIIIFDISEVKALDSTGMGHFIVSFNKIVALDGEMRIAGATGHVFQTFHVSLLDTIFPFFATAEEAAAAV
jgi:anti-sigma B factor antagonist